MVSYHFSQPSLIDKVTFVKNDDGRERAYLHTQTQLSAKQIDEINNALTRAFFTMVPNSYHNEAGLEVRGFWRRKDLLGELEKHKFTAGVQTIDEGSEVKPNFIERVRQQSLFTSGLLYILGDIKFITYGMKGKSPLNMMGGIFYGLGTWANLGFNRKSNTDLKVHDVAQQMADHLNSLNIELPKDAAIKRIIDDKHDGLFHKFDDFGRHFPSEMMNALFATAGVFIAAAAYKELGHSNLPAGMVDEFLTRKASRIEKMIPGMKVPAAQLAAMKPEAEKMLKKFNKSCNWLDVGLGTMTFASGTFGTLVREKAHDPDEPYKEGLAGWWQWARERPLTITGVGLMVSTMCHAVSTAIAYKIGTTDGKKAIFDRGVFVTSALLAEFLIAISSKGHGEGVKSDKSVDDSAISVAAELIARQPIDSQPELTSYMAKFLGRKDVLAMKDDEVLQKLQQSIAAMKHNPWVAHETVPSRLPASEKKAPAAWQSRLAAEALNPHTEMALRN